MSQDTARRPRARIHQRRRGNAVVLLQIRLENMERFRVIGQLLELARKPCEAPNDQLFGDVLERSLLAHPDPEVHVLEAKAGSAQLVAIAATSIVSRAPDHRFAWHYRPKLGQQFIE